jgi:hypothetical protein
MYSAIIPFILNIRFVEVSVVNAHFHVNFNVSIPPCIPTSIVITQCTNIIYTSNHVTPRVVKKV